LNATLNSSVIGLSSGTTHNNTSGKQQQQQLNLAIAAHTIPSTTSRIIASASAASVYASEHGKSRLSVSSIPSSSSSSSSLSSSSSSLSFMSPQGNKRASLIGSSDFNMGGGVGVGVGVDQSIPPSNINVNTYTGAGVSDNINVIGNNTNNGLYAGFNMGSPIFSASSSSSLLSVSAKPTQSRTSNVVLDSSSSSRTANHVNNNSNTVDLNSNVHAVTNGNGIGSSNLHMDEALKQQRLAILNETANAIFVRLRDKLTVSDK
jgi:hypothetical protein